MKWTRFVGAWDIHGDQQDKAAVAALFEFCAVWKPKIKILGGDLWDFRPLRKKAGEDERRESMARDFNAGMMFIRQFRPTVYLRGNHCERLWDLALADKGVISDYAQQGILEIEKEVKRLRCVMLPYNKTSVYRVGHLKAIHGFFTGVGATRRTALVYGSVIFGHGHSIDAHAVEGLERREARMVGCLCDLNMDFQRATPTTLRHAHGFPYGVINDRTGEYFVWQAEKIGARWLLPTGFKEI